jgi:hypothetical protein
MANSREFFVGRMATCGSLAAKVVGRLSYTKQICQLADQSRKLSFPIS